ncbi:MAG TPA: efflux RND transporter periplasmic adaptor subunit, partial [Chloroflexota bacterium]|nr:efflux RND transporter periplasmic adaptor subunit [Chloroflexota bacterium]
MNRTLPLSLAVLCVLAACGPKKDKTPLVQTATVARRDIVIDAQANGAIEPINVVEVKSKASGLITKMPVETGYQVKPGQLLVQVDTRDVKNQYDQAAADLQAARAKLNVSDSQKKRSDEMFKARVITAQEHETAQLDYENAKAQVVRAETNLDLAKQRLEDATVTAPVAGTVIEKTVSLGQVITSATGAFGGGTTLLKMADLGMVRMRALFNETDIGQVRAGQQVTVIVDAYPDRRFTGSVEKIEPQAVVQQGVTMFPVLVTLANLDGALKPGMNGEASVLVDERTNVIAVPNDAVKNTREAMATAPLLGLNPDSVQAMLQAQFGGRRGSGGAAANGAGAAHQGSPAGASAPSTGASRSTSSPGEVVEQQPGQGTGRPGFQMPDVSEKDCAAVKAALAKKPAEAKKLDALREQMRNPDADRQALRQQTQQIYQSVGVDGRVAGACRFKEMQASGGGFGGNNRGAQTPSNAQSAGAQSATRPSTRNGSQSAAANGQGRTGNQLQVGSEPGFPATRSRPGLVFVARGNTFEPRFVRLGAGNFDYTEVISGLKEGEKVALLNALSLQAQRQQQNDRFRQNAGVPGMTQGATPGAG